MFDEFRALASNVETHVSDKYKDSHYHDANEHGLVWALLNELLHLIVCVYTLYGMIQFNVRFIHATKLVKWISIIIVAHSWYLTAKFAFIAAIMYMFNKSLESMTDISLADYNCSLGNHKSVFANSAIKKSQSRIMNSNSSEPHQANSTRLYYNPTTPQITIPHKDYLDNLVHLISTLPEILRNMDYPLLYSELLDIFGGPFKHLGNMGTLMYGFYSVAIYIMLAIFPIELMYRTVGFNFIRFVLSDISCMRDLYKRRHRHLERLTCWSRNQTDSDLTLGTKQTFNQRNLRSHHFGEFNRVAAQIMASKDPHQNSVSPTRNNPESSLEFARRQRRTLKHTRRIGGQLLFRFRHKSLDDFRITNLPESTNLLSQWSSESGQLSVVADPNFLCPIKPLRSCLAVNHMDTPTYQVRIAIRNLKKFKPFVRSEAWFKLSMIVYPMFIFFYFAELILVIGTISIYFGSSLTEISRVCALQADPSIDLWGNWSFLDSLLYFETQYTVFALSCASSFYCSYYFGTIMELFIWITELEQQLDLCRITIEISEYSQRRIGVFAALQPSSSKQQARINTLKAKTAEQLYLSFRRNCREDDNGKISSSRGKKKDLEHMVDKCYNDFGGIESYWFHYKLLQSSSQSRRLKALELMAINLLKKKQTLLRAAYINMNLFLDELNATRFMLNTILRRTTQIAFGFAILASVTRSQFKANYWHLTFLLGACLAILNLYLACAALINSRVSKSDLKFCLIHVLD